jgi:hypothetical protein
MNFRAGVLAAMVLLLGGCSDADWDRLTTFNSIERPDTVAQTTDVQTDASAVQTASISPAQPGVEGAQRQDVPPAAAQEQAAPEMPVQTASVAATPVSPTDDYCRRVSRNAADTSQRDGFDVSAQQQASAATYRQCLSFYNSR